MTLLMLLVYGGASLFGADPAPLVFQPPNTWVWVLLACIGLDLAYGGSSS